MGLEYIWDDIWRVKSVNPSKVFGWFDYINTDKENGERRGDGVLEAPKEGKKHDNDQ